MSNLVLINYIKQNLDAGFTETEIRQTLLDAGWSEKDVNAGFAVNLTAELPQSKQGFLSKHAKALTIALLILIALPALSYSGFLVYQKVSSKIKISAIQTPNQEDTIAPSIKSSATERDEQRIADIQKLQITLDQFFSANASFPTSLSELTAKKFLDEIPTDPKTHGPYLYSIFQKTPADYALSFVLETDLATLTPGLHTVSSGSKLPGEAIKRQTALVKGETIEGISQDLAITDLSKSPFYRQEEVSVDVNAPSNVELESVMLLMPDLKLVDHTKPFHFSFTAPKEPGDYQVALFGFDQNGLIHAGETALKVK